MMKLFQSVGQAPISPDPFPLKGGGEYYCITEANSLSFHRLASVFS